LSTALIDNFDQEAQPEKSMARQSADTATARTHIRSDGLFSMSSLLFVVSARQAISP
jgi:hypothetical protein